jgi:hypothetical protein
MKYTILCEHSGDVQEMTFKDEDQLARWLSNNTSFRSLGKVEQYLPTRHVRMKNKDEFAGWGS